MGVLFCELDTGECDQVGSFPGSEYVVQKNPDGSSSGQGIVLERVTVYSVGKSRMAAAYQDRFEVFHFSPEGDLSKSLHVERDPIPVDDGVRARYVAAETEGVEDPERREEIRARWANAITSDAIPMLGRVLVDTNERTWVQEFIPSFEEADPTWWIFADSGEVVARTQIPRSFVPSHIDENSVLGIFTDSLGVPYVQIREISR
jgi:hypothetical protein